MELEMEFRLHVVLYTLEGEDRFKVMAGTPDSEEPVDVTAHYEVTSIVTEDGRAGFAVVPIKFDKEGKVV